MRAITMQIGHVLAIGVDAHPAKQQRGKGVVIKVLRVSNATLPGFFAGKGTGRLVGRTGVAFLRHQCPPFNARKPTKATPSSPEPEGVTGNAAETASSNMAVLCEGR